MPGIRASVRPQISRARLRLAAIALLALTAALAAISLGGAQTMQDSDSQGGQTVSGRIVVQFHPLASGDSRGAYGLEFGFLTEAILTSRSSLADAIAANQALLPDARTLPAAKLLQRAQQGNRNWVFSSLIRIPISVDGGQEQTHLEGRVLVRVNPGRNGRFSIEFGFLPEREIGVRPGDSGGEISAKVQSAAEDHALLPKERYLSSGRIAERVAAARRASSRPWVRSSVVEVPLRGEQPPDITVRVTCSPGEVNAGAQVTCQAVASGGTPPHVTYSWSAPGAIPPVGAGPSWSGQFPSEGTHRVQVTVTDSAWQPGTGEAFVRVTMPPPPTVRIISCSPNEGERPPGVTCQAAASGGTPPYSYSWSAPAAVPPVGSGQTWSPSFPNAGTHRVQVTVTDSARQRAEDSASVTITPPPTVEASCTPEEVDAGDAVTCWAQASGGTPPYTYSWSARGAVPPSGSELVWRPQFPSSGEYMVQVTVTDSARQRADDSTSVTVGGEPLTVQVDCSPERVDAGDIVTCWATPRDGTPPYTTYSWSARGASSPSGSGLVWSGRFANAGTYSVQATVTDNRRQQAEGQARVVVDPGAPLLTVTVSCSPTTIDEGGSTSCSATASGGTPPYRTYSWSARGASQSFDSGPSPTWRPQFPNAGSYSVQVTVTDSARQGANDSVPVQVRREPVDDDLTVTASCSPRTIDEGDSTSCLATARGGAGGYTYQWRSGSANPRSESGQSYRPSFAREGNYTVRVTVTDSRGASAEDTVRIGVIDGGGGGGGNGGGTGGGSGTGGSGRTIPPLQVTSSCSPTSIRAPGSIGCNGQASGGSAPYTYTWTSNGQQIYRGPDANRTVNFSSAGTYRLQLEVTDRASDRASSRTVTVRVTGGGGTLPPAPPIGFGRCGDDGRSVYYFNTSAGTRHHLSITWEAAQRIFPGWSERWIGWLSQADCNRWTLGSAYGETEACRTEHARCR